MHFLVPPEPGFVRGVCEVSFQNWAFRTHTAPTVWKSNLGKLGLNSKSDLEPRASTEIHSASENQAALVLTKLLQLEFNENCLTCFKSKLPAGNCLPPRCFLHQPPRRSLKGILEVICPLEERELVFYNIWVGRDLKTIQGHPCHPWTPSTTPGCSLEQFQGYSQAVPGFHHLHREEFLPKI